MTRKTALKTIGLLCAGFFGRNTRAKEVPPTNSFANTVITTNTNVTPLVDITTLRPTSIIFDLTYYKEIVIEFKGERKIINPEELFKAL